MSEEMRKEKMGEKVLNFKLMTFCLQIVLFVEMYGHFLKRERERERGYLNKSL